MFSSEQTEEIKKKIISQIDSSFPEDKKDEAKQRVLSMSSDDLEEFLKQNNLIKEDNVQCIFCLIKSGQIQSYKIDETADAMAVLEINPISRGHVLIIPKNHSPDGKISNEIYKFSEKISESLVKKLNPNKVLSSENYLFNHGVINLVPSYSDETFNSPRTSPKKEELEEVKKILTHKEPKKEKKKTGRVKKSKKENKPKRKVNLWLPRRIP